MCVTCFDIAPDFLLDRPKDVAPLAVRAEMQERYSLAYSLVRSADDKYPDAPEKTTLRVLEAKFLCLYLERKEVGKAIFDELMSDSNNRERQDIKSLVVIFS